MALRDKVTILFSDIIDIGDLQSLDEAIIKLMEMNRHWLEGLNVLIYCHKGKSDPSVSTCAKIKSRLQLPQVLPITLAESGRMALMQARTILSWLMTGSNCSKAICLLAERVDYNIPDPLREQRFRISIICIESCYKAEEKGKAESV